MGILILNPTSKTVPKAGRLATGTYTFGVSPVQDKHGRGNVFPRHDSPSFPTIMSGGTPSVSVGNVVNRDTINGTSFVSPIESQKNIATIPIKADATTYNGQLYRSMGFVPEISPHERTVLSKRKKQGAIQTKTQFGAAGDKRSDTPFHPQTTRVLPYLRPRASVDTSKHPAQPSFMTTHNIWYDPNNSFQSNSISTGTKRTGFGRWGVIKRGAAG
jgi:hypothetical protein